MEKEEFNWLIERLKTEEVIMVNRQGVIDNVHGFIVPITDLESYGGISQKLVGQLIDRDSKGLFKNFLNSGVIIIKNDGNYQFSEGFIFDSIGVATSVLKQNNKTSLYDISRKKWLTIS